MVARPRLLLAGVLVAAALEVAGCDRAAPAPPPSPTVAVSSPFGRADLDWIDRNIALNEHLLPLLELVPTHSGDPDAQALALQVQAFVQVELTTLRALHDQAGLPAQNPYRGRPAPGMVTPGQVAAAAKLAGEKFDAVAVRYLRAYLVETQRLARAEDDAGVEAQTRAFAMQVARTRAAAMTTLRNAS